MLRLDIDFKNWYFGFGISFMFKDITIAFGFLSISYKWSK